MADAKGMGVLARIWMVSSGETFGKSADASYDTKISCSFNSVPFLDLFSELEHIRD